MLTKAALSLLILQYKLAAVTNSVPYYWDDTTKKLYHTTSKFRLAMFYFNICGEWFYTAFKTARLFYAFGHSSFFIVIIHAGWLSRDVLLSAFHLTSIMRRTEVPEFFNKFLHYDQLQLGEFARKQNLAQVQVGMDWCKMYHMGISFPVSASFPFFLALFGWVLAPHPQFLASLFSDGVNHPDTQVKVVFLIFELWIGYTSFFACYFYTSTLFCVIQSMRFSLKLLAFQPQKGVDYSESVARSKKMYRTLQILNKFLNDCWRSIIAPVQQAVDLILGATYTCGLFKFHHTMGMVTLFCFVYQVLAVAGCTSSTYSIAGRLPNWSKRVFRSWKRLDLERVKYDEDVADKDQVFTIQDEKCSEKESAMVKENELVSQIQRDLEIKSASSQLNPTIGIGSLSTNHLIIQKLCATRRSAQGRHMKAFMKSCRPLHMKTAFFFTVSREYGLGWFSWYVENTVSLSLTFNVK